MRYRSSFDSIIITKLLIHTRRVRMSTLSEVNNLADGSANESPIADTETANTEDLEIGQTNLTGRSVFSIETTAAGVLVRTAFITEDNRLLDMPAVFPDMVYALNVIDDLKRQVTQHFAQAAQVGVQVIANQARAEQNAVAQEPMASGIAEQQSPAKTDKE